MAAVFISCAEPDRPLAEELARRLVALGRSVFDGTKVESSGNWEARIAQEFQDARMIVVLWSQNSAAAEGVKTETKRAVRAWSDDRLFLVRLDGASLPTGLGGLQAVEATTTEGGLSEDDWDAIIAAVSQKTGQVPAAPNPRRTWTAVLMTCVVVLAAGLMAWLFASDTPLQKSDPLGATTEEFNLFETPYAIALGAIAVLLSFIILIRRHFKRSKPAEPATHPPGVGQAPEAGLSPETAGKLENLDLFVSYSRADGRSIDPLIDHIRENGLTLWIDTQHQDGDVRYAGQIVRAIRACRSVIIMCSENAYRSDHVVREVYVSGDHKKPFIVVQLDDAEFPDDFQYFLSGFPRIRLEEVGPDQLADKVSALMPA